jgi:ElaB/YqjD/DUF883 family membrane-anchored ribosome-binding protein
MSTELLKTATSAAVNFEHLNSELSKARMLAEDVIEDGTRKAQRMIKRGYNKTEDYVDETTHYIKHHPWQSVAVALGVGASAGVFFGWLFSRAAANGAERDAEDDFLANFHSGE